MTPEKVRQIAAVAVLAVGLASTASVTGAAGAQEIAAAHRDDRPPATAFGNRAPGMASLLGDWTAVDPTTGMREIVSVTVDSLTFGAAPPLPCRVERDGDGLALWVADAEAPLRLHFFDTANAQLSVPGGPTIALRRESPPGAPAPAVVKVPESDAIADAAAALLPPSAPFP